VRTKAEAFIGASLRNKSYEVFLPTYLQTRAYSDRLKKVDVALFPGYLFCRFDVERRLPVLTTPGVEYVVNFDHIPQPIPDVEIESIRQVLIAGGKAKPWPYLKVGDKVRVMLGSFSGVEGILLSEKGVDRLVLSVTLLQRSVAVEIDRNWIQPIR
jgi:transcription antitermination factor NusG